MKLKTNLLPTGLILIFSSLVLSACSSKQMYHSGQSMHCYEQEKRDPYNQQPNCDRQSYEEYQRQLEELEKSKKDTERKNK